MLLAILPRSIVDRFPHRCPGEGCAVCTFVAGYRQRDGLTFKVGRLRPVTVFSGRTTMALDLAPVHVPDAKRPADVVLM